MAVDVTVEERLRRAAAVLDAGAGVASRRVPSPSRRGRVLVGAVAMVAAVGAVVGAVSYLSSAPAVDVAAAPSLPALAPDEEGWASIPPAPIGPRFQHLAVATDGGLLVWGGYRSEAVTDGAFFDVASGLWRKLPAAPLSRDRGDAIGVWTGREVVVVNGEGGHVKAATFDPVGFRWVKLPDPPLLNAANAMSRALVVDGVVVVVAVAEEGDGGSRLQVAHLDPVARVWSIGESPPRSFSSFFSAVVGADGELFVVARRNGGGASCGTSVVLGYRPVDRVWRELPSAPIDDLAAPVVAWTGHELFVGGGPACSRLPDDVPMRRASLLDPSTGVWRPASEAPVPFAGNHRYAELWTGSSVLTFNPDGTPVSYDPSSDSWHVGPPHPLASAHHDETPWVWLDGRAWLFSGGLGNDEGGCCSVVDGGYWYRPPATP